MKPHVCLHMIVKDEADIIERCLASVLPHVDAAVIVDTGSTDGTMNILDRVLSASGKPSMFVSLPWKGFAESRTEAMGLARKFARDIATASTDVERGLLGEPDDATWLLFTLDADETLEVEPGFAWPTEGLDAWHMRVDLHGVRFTRTLLTRASTPWRYEGVLHEDVVLDGPYHCGLPVEGALIRSTRDGARAKDPTHYERDAEILLAEHERNPSDARTVFYLANSLRDAGKIEEALKWYDKRALMPGWDQETWACSHERARCMILLGREPKDVLEAHLLAYGCRPGRAETLRQLARYLKQIGAPVVAALFDAEASRTPIPSDLLFVDTQAYAPQPRIGVITAPRPDGTFPLATTLTSCMATDALATPAALRVFSDSLGPVPIPPMVAQEHNDAEGLARIATGGIYGTLNYCRAMEWAAGADGVSVVLEDDVLFSRGWLSRGLALLEAAERATGGAVLLSLHHMFGVLDGVLEDSGISVGEDRLMAAGAHAFPNGSQGIMGRPSTMRAVAGVLRNRMGCETADERATWAMDCGLFRCCQELGLARLFYVHQCMLWHLDGATSTWASKDARWMGDDGAHRAVRKTRHFRPW